MNWRVGGIAVALSVIIADQLSKWWIVTRVFGEGKAGLVDWLFTAGPRLEFVSHKITSFFNLVMVWNQGVSFGILQTAHNFMVYALSAMAVLISIGFLIWLWRDPRGLRGMAVGLIVGGALGNVWDRLRFGAVADFIDFHLAGYHWPAFNVADAAVCIGVVLMLVETFFMTPRASSVEKN